MNTELTSGLGATLKALFKLAGFVVLVIGLVPAHFVLKASGRGDAFTVPMLFHGLLAKLIGFRIRVHGAADLGKPSVPTLFVANHSSYLDIPILGSLIRGCFVAKSEVAGWPFIGAMARLQNTVFIERRAVRAGTQRDGLRERLETGDSLILFPEGTSSDGQRTLPFKSTLFSIIEKPLPGGQFVRVQPVSIVCTRIGGLPIGRAWRPYYAWYGDMTLAGHVWDVFKIGAFTVDVIFHNPVSIKDYGDRKLIADYCQRSVARGVDQCVTGRFQKELAG